MFQSFKKWVKNENIQQRPSPPSGMQLMQGDLQRKFAKGIQYNMKIVIRGDRNTGKTCLFQRLKGEGFIEEYIPTAEIQVSSIQWDYKATDDIVKVDVWDVVDQGKSKKKEDKGLKLTESPPIPSTSIGDQVLDAAFLDVYKHAHAVILVFDITKKWTFKYIERELPKVPYHIPTLVLANFRDMGDHRVINLDELTALVESIDRPHGSATILAYESSMKNGFGLKYVHKFFNMPFLLVQRESLLKQLQRNHLDLESCIDELATEDYNYDEFLERMKIVRKKKPANTPDSAANTSQNGAQHKSVEANTNQKPDKPKPVALSPKSDEGSNPIKPSDNVTETHQPHFAKKSSFIGNIFRRTSDITPTPVEENSCKIKVTKSDDREKVVNVDNFIPDEGNNDDFLNEVHHTKPREAYESSDDSDEDGGNPMVAGFQEDLDSDDDFNPGYGDKLSLASDSEPE